MIFAIVGIDFERNPCKVAYTLRRSGQGIESGPGFSTNLQHSVYTFSAEATLNNNTGTTIYSLSDLLEGQEHGTNATKLQFDLDFSQDKASIPAKSVLATIIRQILNIVSDELLPHLEIGSKIPDFQVIFTIPPDLSVIQQQTTLHAAFLAGASTAALLVNPVAACLSYQALYTPISRTKVNGGPHEEVLLFVDIGPLGTTATVVSYTTQGLVVQQQSTEPSLGGKVVDLALIDHFTTQIQGSNDSLSMADPTIIRSMLINECPKDRDKLLYEERFSLSLSITNFDEFQSLVTVEVLQDITSHIQEGILYFIRNVVKSRGVNDNPHTIVISGSSAWLFKTAIMNAFPKAICRSLGHDVYWRAKSALRSFPLVHASMSAKRAWIGKELRGTSVIWKEWVAEEADMQTTISCMRSMKIEKTVSGPKADVLRAGNKSNTSTTAPSSQFDEPINQALSALNILTEDDPKRPEAYNNLCGHYLHIYNATGDIFALNHATIYATKALSFDDIPYSSPQVNPIYLSNLTSCLIRQFEVHPDANLSLLNTGILYQSYVVRNVKEVTRENAGYFINYGVYLRMRGERLGDTEDIADGAKAIQQAVGALLDGIQENPDDIPTLITALGSLGGALNRLYEWTGSLDDLYRCIQCYETALSLTPGRGSARAYSLNQYGTALMVHYRHFGDLKDVKRAEACFKEALENIPDGHPSKPLYLSNYVNALQASSRRAALKDLEGVEYAIEMQQKALKLIGGQTHSGKAKHHSALGNLYLDKFEITKNVEDLDQGSENYELAVGLTKEDNLLEKFTYLCNLANSFYVRFSVSKDVHHLDRCISILEEALEYVGGGAHQHTAYSHLADAHLDRYIADPTSPEAEPHRLKCIDLCKSVTLNSSFSTLRTRFRAARTWTTAAATYSKDGAAALEATTCMVDLLSQLAWPGLSLASQIEVLERANQAACDAAAVAVHFKDTRRALEWLEQGRTIVLSQLLNGRTPLDELALVKPELAEGIVKLSRELEAVDQDEGNILPGLNNSKRLAGNSKTKIALERDKLVREARKVPAFEKLMMKKEYEDFSVASHDGPVVVINVSTHRCDVIILTARNVPFVLPLKTFSLTQAEELKEVMLGVLRDSANLQRCTAEGDEEVTERFGKPKRRRPSRESVDEKIRYILKELYEKVVEPITLCLGIGLALNEDLPHIWWCPTGPLTFLPLHAAGIYAADDDTETPRISILDYVVSSYIPSLSSLHNIMYKKGRIRPPFKMMAVVQPNTPGQTELPATLSELKLIQKHCQNAGLSHNLKVLQGDEATREGVMDGLKQHTWVHPACHGKQDVKDPTKSGLHLHDQTLFLEDIVRNPIPDADFAFLSACQTASGDANHPDEAVHLAAGLLTAGYNSVIASMWSIGDNDASTVADDVYGYLFREGKGKAPDSRYAARALHKAVRRLRIKHCGPQGGSNFLAWLPYIHVGM
ncbi:hypothetical protein CPC08DRAFT_700840 [Agrocybe pediades]|nr:hypothetical protein CPC08DRAFT_700840 [Agrocybe pediades]